MHFTPAALALGLAAASASAEINTFFAPATVQPGTNVSVILGSVGSQQSVSTTRQHIFPTLLTDGFLGQVLDVSTVYGVGQDLYTQTLGLNLEEVYILGRGQSNQVCTCLHYSY